MANANKFFDFLRSYLTPAGKRAAWNLSWMLLGRLVGHVSLLGAVLLLTHALSGEQFGMVTTALAVQVSDVLVLARRESVHGENAVPLSDEGVGQVRPDKPRPP